MERFDFIDTGCLKQSKKETLQEEKVISEMCPSFKLSEFPEELTFPHYSTQMPKYICRTATDTVINVVKHEIISQQEDCICEWNVYSYGVSFMTTGSCCPYSSQDLSKMALPWMHSNDLERHLCNTLLLEDSLWQFQIICSLFCSFTLSFSGSRRLPF